MILKADYWREHARFSPSDLRAGEKCFFARQIHRCSVFESLRAWSLEVEDGLLGRSRSPRGPGIWSICCAAEQRTDGLLVTGVCASQLCCPRGSSHGREDCRIRDLKGRLRSQRRWRREAAEEEDWKVWRHSVASKDPVMASRDTAIGSLHFLRDGPYPSATFQYHSVPRRYPQKSPHEACSGLRAGWHQSTVAMPCSGDS